MYLDKFKWSKTTDLILKKKKKTKKIKFQTFLLRGVISSFRLVLGRLGGSVVINVYIFRTRLEKRACSTKVELDGAKANFREVFYSIHMKIFKASSVVRAQKASELARSFCLFLDPSKTKSD